MNNDLVQDLRRLRFVPRWVIVPTITQQNVAEHSFHVAWIMVWLCDRIGYPLNVAMLKEALVHDHDEAYTGDIPSTAKKISIGPVGSDKCVLKIADCLEAALFIQEEINMGNKSLNDILQDIYDKGETWVTGLGAMTGRNDKFRVIFDELSRITDLKNHPGMRK